MRNLRMIAASAKALACLACVMMGVMALGATPAKAEPYISPQQQGFTPPIYIPPRETRADGCSVPESLRVEKWQTQFRSACNSHDICYSTLKDQRLSDSAAKLKCDDAFYDDMLATCQVSYYIFEEPVYRDPTCPIAVQAYYDGVTVKALHMGQADKAFRDGQKWARDHFVVPPPHIGALTAYEYDDRMTDITPLARIPSEAKLDVGFFDMFRQLADIDGDGQDEYCRFIGVRDNPTLACTYFNPATNWFGRTVTASVDPGYDDRFRGMADVDGDGRADYCTTVGDREEPSFSCHLSNGMGFVEYSFIVAPENDIYYVHYPDRFQGLADVDGDGKADYCGVVGDPPDFAISCSLSNGRGFSKAFIISNIDVGYPDRVQALADVNGDGKADYCRIVGNPGSLGMECTLNIYDMANGSPARRTYSFNFDVGFDILPQAFADVNADGRADYCRIVGERFAEPRTMWCDFADINGGFDNSGRMVLKGEFFTGSVHFGSFLEIGEGDQILAQRLDGKPTPVRPARSGSEGGEAGGDAGAPSEEEGED